MKIILIPGLGYDRRIFEKLELPFPDIRFLEWIDPLANESIQKYSKRLVESVDWEHDEAILVGHSLGGIIAQEIACFRKVRAVILISSIKSRKEMPLYFKVVAPLHLEKIFSRELCIRSLPLWGRSHGFQTIEEKSLFREMLSKQSNKYLQWALRALSNWRTANLPANVRLLQVHGDQDKTFPLRLIERPDFIVENGSHIMAYKRGGEVSEWLKREIESLGGRVVY